MNDYIITYLYTVHGTMYAYDTRAESALAALRNWLDRYHPEGNDPTYVPLTLLSQLRTYGIRKVQAIEMETMYGLK